MAHFSELLEALILDHGRQPRNRGPLPSHTHRAEGLNPLTGDQLEVLLEIDSANSLIVGASFQGTGSSLSLTSASVMTGELKGLDARTAIAQIESTIARLEGDPTPETLPMCEYTILLEIRDVPQRVPCAALAWRTALRALQKGAS